MIEFAKLRSGSRYQSLPRGWRFYIGRTDGFAWRQSLDGKRYEGHPVKFYARASNIAGHTPSVHIELGRLAGGVYRCS